jgi:hypothetical protein
MILDRGAGAERTSSLFFKTIVLAQVMISLNFVLGRARCENALVSCRQRTLLVPRIGFIGHGARTNAIYVHSHSSLAISALSGTQSLHLPNRVSLYGHRNEGRMRQY